MMNLNLIKLTFTDNLGHIILGFDAQNNACYFDASNFKYKDIKKLWTMLPKNKSELDIFVKNSYIAGVEVLETNTYTFEYFWEKYPKNQAGNKPHRKRAESKFNKIKLKGDVMDALEGYKKFLQKETWRGVMDADTFLNNYEDYL